MVEKLSFYDLLSTFVAGVILMTWIPMCFPGIIHMETPDYPDDFKVVVLTAVALVVGNLVNMMAGLLLHRIFEKPGQRPTDIALKDGLGSYLPLSTVERIKKKMKKAVKTSTDDRSLTLYAIQRTDAAGVGRVARFNALYAYQRSFFALLLIMVLIFAGSMLWGAAKEMSLWLKDGVCLIFFLFALGTWHQVQQRGKYYAAELFLTIERILDEGDKTSSSEPEAPED